MLPNTPATSEPNNNSINAHNILLSVGIVAFVIFSSIVGLYLSGQSIFQEDNGYIWFDGEKSGIVLDSNIIDFEEGTLTLWVRVDQVGSNPQIILLSSSNPTSDGFGEASPDHDFSLGIIAADNPRAPGRLEWTYQTSAGGATLRSTKPIPPEDWHHIGLIWKGRGEQLELLIDGKVDVQDKVAFVTTSYSERPLTERTSVGLPLSLQADRSLVGAIDELRVWNYAQSPFRINWTMQKEIDPRSQGLMAYWRFNSVENMLQEEVNGIIQGETYGQPLWYPGK